MIPLLIPPLCLIHLSARITAGDYHAFVLGEGSVAFHQRSIISAVEREW